VLAEPGQWIWSALLTRDPDAAAGFYQAVFGYDVFPLPTTDGREHLTLASDDYARASVNSLPTEATRPPHWLNFVRVQSTTEAVARVQVLGGQVLVAPRPDRHGGLLAVVADPTGAPFGLMEWTGTTRQEPAK